MRARDLATDFPTIRLTDDAIAAARLLAEQHLPGLIVLGENGLPFTVLPGSQVLRFIIPRYVQEDPALARVIDERHADRLCDDLVGKTVADLLPRETARLPVADADDTALEIAAMMAQARSPLVAVVEGDPRKDGRLLGAVTAARLLVRLLAA